MHSHGSVFLCEFHLFTCLGCEVKADGSELTPRELSDIKEAEAKAKREANPEAADVGWVCA